MMQFTCIDILYIMCLSSRSLRNERKMKIARFISFCFLMLIYLIIFMPPTSKKLRGHISLGCPPVCPSVLRNTFRQLRSSRTAYARILKVYMCHVHEK